ncbi:MAG: DUF3565 domain-containing protein [Nitrospirales bacterium]
MSLRPWVLTSEGRRAHLKAILNCKKCDEESPLPSQGAT